MDFVRSEEEITGLLHLAKLDDDNLKQVVQPLWIKNPHQLDNFKLLEVQPSLLQHLTEGKKLVLRGEKDEKAVLCTESHTFEIKEAETSNSLLLMPTLCWPENADSTELTIVPQGVDGIFHSYYEIKSCKPRLKKLRKLLAENLYQGREYEPDNVGQKYRTEDLLEIVQASEQEIMTELNEIQACNIDGYWRMLDFDYHFRILNFILELIDSNSWTSNKIPMKIALNTLEELEPRNILEQAFKWYAEPTDIVEENEELWKLKEQSVCRFLAEVLLRPAGKFNLQEFLESWQKSVPEGMVTNLSQLEGLALADYNSKPEVIFFYPSWELSDDVNERFNELFKIREKWTLNEIEPYIRDLTSPSLSANALLTKNARASFLKSTKVYSSKHPIR